MATPSLSPHQITQKLLKHRLAVATLARQVALKAVKHRLRTDGLKQLHDFSAKDIAVLADKYLEEHRARLVAEADRDAATVRGLALTSSAGNVRKVPRNRTLPKASSANSGVIANG